MEKYLPQTIKDIIGHSNQINEIVGWLKKFKDNKKNFLKNGNQKKRTRIKSMENFDDTINDGNDGNDENDEKYYNVESTTKKNIVSPCILITGNHGVGKTVAINTILNELKYDTIPITFGKNKLKDVKKIVSQVLNNNILKTIGEKNKHTILIDNLESVNSNVDKILINTLFKINNDKWKVPLIIISNGKHSKLLHEIKKKTKEIKFLNPNIYDMTKLINLIIDSENINISNSSKNKIIEYCQSDMRKITSTLLELKGETKNLSDYKIDEYFKTSKKKDIDFDLFKTTGEIFHEYKSIEDCNKKYKMESVMLPLMIHQNYKKSINESDLDFNESIKQLELVSKLLSIGDIVDNYIFGDQIWELKDIHGYYSCINPSYILSSLNDSYIRFEYPDDLNRTSIKKKKKKNIITNDKNIKNFDINDLLRLSYILKDIYTKYNINDCVKILKEYGITYELFDMIIKLNNMGSDKFSITMKQKKELSSKLNS